MNKTAFFAEIRVKLFDNKLTQSQVDGINLIIDSCPKYGVTGYKQIAYVLATIYHETARTFQPIEEFGKGANKDYGKKLKMSRQPYLEPNFIYYGRGYVQITWYENYELLTRKAYAEGYKWDFLNNPSLALQPESSAWAAIYGMRTGLFTGKKLSDYFNTTKTDWRKARVIINGLDKADLIAEYAIKFHNALLL